MKKNLKEILVKWFLENYHDLFFKMEECQHGYLGINPNTYHLEGNIWKHTKMVLDEVDNLDNQPPIELYLIALLHDIGKPFTYYDNHKSKRRRFTNHEAYSTFLAKPILDKFDKYVIKIDKEIVLKTIANHGRFYNYMNEKGITEKGQNVIFEMYKKDLRAFDYMRNFFKCDHLGRITDDPRSDKKILDDLRLIRSKIKNYSHINTQEVKPTLRILVGPPRVGKSTCTSKLKNENIISRDTLVEKYGTGSNYNEKWKSLKDEDHFTIDQELQSNFKKLVYEGKNIVVDMTNMSPKSRRKWLKGVKGIDEYYKISNVFIEDLETLKSRNSNEKNINENIIKNMILGFNWPMYDEFDRVIYGCDKV